MIFKKSQSGFTLIELLVVMTIIGLLASLIVVGLANARAKARDAKRKQDLVQLAKGLELYYNTNSSYPSTSGAWQGLPVGGTNCGAAAYSVTGATGYIPNFAPTFLGTLPVDPKASTTTGDTCAGYVYWSNGTEYKIISNSVNGRGGPETFPTVGQQFYDAARPTTAIMVCVGTTACAQ